MSQPQTTFADLVTRLRAGDATAAEELVRLYESSIRREIRCRMSDPRLRRVFDSMDICQAVMSSFFARAAAGQFDLQRPEQLLQLLRGMARKKLAHHARQQQAARRDVRKVEALGGEVDSPGPDATPSRIVAGRDMLSQVMKRLNGDEQQVAQLRSQGYEWEQIADQLGGTSEARRKQLARALDRVTRELGLEGDDD